MPAPELITTRGDRGIAQTAPGDVATLFVATLAARGPVGSHTTARSLTQWRKMYGGLIAAQPTYNAIEAYFAEGGSRVITSRVASSTAVSASLEIAGDGGTLATLTASGPGTWANEIAWTIQEEGDGMQVLGVEGNSEVLVNFFATDAESFLAGVNRSGVVTAVAGAGDWPATEIGDAVMTGGTDVYNDVDIEDWETGLALLDRELDSGTIVAPGVTDPDVHMALFRHAYANNRWALADGLDTSNHSALVAAAKVIRDEMPLGAYGQILAPWEVVPGPGVGTVKTPPSGGQAGRLALADRTYGPGPGQYAGARFGLSRHSVDVTQTYTKEQRDELSDAGVTVIRNIRGEVQAYDDVTVVDANEWPQYAGAAGMRVAMAIESQVDALLEQRMIETIDAKGHLLGAVEKDVVGVCSTWHRRNALYGDLPEEAYKVTITNPEPRVIDAEVLLKTSEAARLIRLHIVKVAISDNI